MAYTLNGGLADYLHKGTGGAAGVAGGTYYDPNMGKPGYIGNMKPGVPPGADQIGGGGMSPSGGGMPPWMGKFLGAGMGGGQGGGQDGPGGGGAHPFEWFANNNTPQGGLQQQYDMIAQQSGGRLTPEMMKFIQNNPNFTPNNAGSVHGGGNGMVPPTGLIGSEQALMGGLQGGFGALLAGIGQGRSDLMGMLGQGTGALRDAMNQGNSAFRSGMGALSSAGRTVDNLFGQGIGAANDLFGQGLQAGNQFFNQGVGTLNPFIDPGMQSQQLQAAMSGALGPEAQKRAMDSFNDSPGQAWLRERGERAVTRNAAATGGLGSGRVLQELQRQGQGLAAQQFDTRFNQLGQLTNQGLSAAGQAAGLRGQQGSMNANMLGQQANMNANMRNAQAGLRSNLAQSKASLSGQRGQFLGNMGTNLANMYGQAGSQLGNMGLMQGQLGANMFQNTGNNLAAGRMAAGNAIANQIANTGNNIGNTIGNQGNILGQLLTGLGGANAQDIQQLAQLLSGINMTGSGQMNGATGGGVTNTTGNMGNIGNFLAGIGQLGESFGWWG